jgi:hypothetical protein
LEFYKERKCEHRFKWRSNFQIGISQSKESVNIDLKWRSKFQIGISQSKEIVNIDLNEQQNIKLEFHKVKKMWT